MSRVVNTAGLVVAEGGIWITLRPDSVCGVALGGMETIEPGETKKVTASIALQLLQTQRAYRAVEPNAEVVEPEPSPLVVTSPATRKRK